jgi:hypothetical protein
MKKIALALLATSVISSACYARGEIIDSLTCGYSDTFHLSKISAAVTIASLVSDAGAAVEKKTSTSFVINDAPTCPSGGGTATVRFQKDKTDYCDLKIHDAAHDFGPTVQSTCVGKLQFNGMTTDSYVWGHSYSLTFS